VSPRTLSTQPAHDSHEQNDDERRCERGEDELWLKKKRRKRKKKSVKGGERNDDEDDGEGRKESWL
jgi:hypothetical protein